MSHQTHDELSQPFRALIRTQPSWLPKSVKRVKWVSITAAPKTNAFGLPCDCSDATGKIVHMDNALFVLKEKPSQYCLIDPALVPSRHTLILGSKVTVRSYKRKSLEDGLPLDAARSNGNGITTTLIGATCTRLPGRPGEGYLGDMADQLEALPMPDEYRTISNAFADWEANNFQWIEDEEALVFELRFDITAPAYAGPVTIAYKRATDTYTLKRNSPSAGSETCDADGLIEHEDIHFDELAGHLSTLAGDANTWCQVAIHPVPKVYRT